MLYTVLQCIYVSSSTVKHWVHFERTLILKAYGTSIHDAFISFSMLHHVSLTPAHVNLYFRVSYHVFLTRISKRNGWHCKLIRWHENREVTFWWNTWRFSIHALSLLTWPMILPSFLEELNSSIHIYQQSRIRKTMHRSFYIYWLNIITWSFNKINNYHMRFFDLGQE